jgi:type II secretory pathway component PulF
MAKRALPARAPEREADAATALATLVEGRKALEEAFDSAVEVEDMRQIQRALMAVSNEIVALLQAGIVATAERYRPQTEAILAAREDIGEIQKRIRRITTMLEKASRIADALGKLLKVLPKLP